ncbi:hypothetical protein C7I55_05480 [Sphingomonas deserti]|uniref:Uncharacterized protein n=1 Tax=Allosphingosinicella deserti TaxID=2116704 RepID=A0A2P7QUT6_9SPHN|nr:hypothetical protein C7I55_05480 [Sphingomonas deserti]
MPVGGFLCWQIGKTAAVAELTRTNPLAAARLTGDEPEVKIANSLLEFRVRGGRVSPANRNAALAALADYPIAEEPFLLAAVDAIANGQGARGERLLIEARRRNPRSRLTRLLLLDRFMRSGRTADATLEISALNSLVPRAGEVLVPELARMAADPQQQQTVKTVLMRDPKLLGLVLARLAANGADPDVILSLAGEGGRAGTVAQGDWQNVLIAERVKRGDVMRAYRLWQAFGGAAPSASNAVYDGAFQGRRGYPPFNWTLTSSAAGVAERSPAGGLEVTYYGRMNTDLASQLLLLQPGKYQLRFKAEGDVSGDASKLIWSVRCNDTKAILLELQIPKINATPRVISGNFDVPSGCVSQWLGLAGSSAEFPSEQNVVIRDVQVTRAGA